MYLIAVIKSSETWEVVFPGRTLAIKIPEYVIYIPEQNLTRAIARFNSVGFFTPNLKSIAIFDDKMRLIQNKVFKE